MIDQYVELRNRYTDLLLTYPVTVEGTRAWLEESDVILWGLMDKGTLLGAVLLYPQKDNEIAIMVRNPGNGIGKILLAGIELAASYRGITRVRAWTAHSNERARNLFRRCGYHTVRGLSERMSGNGVSLGWEWVKEIGPRRVRIDGEATNPSG